MLPVFVKDVNLTEIEFFRRELNLDFVSVPRTLANGTLLVAGTRPSDFSTIMENSRPKSVVFFLLGNEAYEVGTYTVLNKFESIRKVFVYNSPRTNSLIGWPSVQATLRDIPKSLIDKSYYRCWKNAFDFARRTRSINLSYQFSNFPQGYSARFVKELNSLGLLKGDGSLFEEIAEVGGIPRSGVAFVGQRGSWLRGNLIDRFSRESNFAHTETIGWAGGNSAFKTIYVESILKNRVTLHLPGNITNQSHRYLECILLNRLPASPPYTFQDHHFSGYWTENFSGNEFFSYVRLTQKILGMTDEEYSLIVSSERNKIRLTIQAIKDEIHELAISE